MKKRKMQKAQEEYERDHCSTSSPEAGDPCEIPQGRETSSLGRTTRDSSIQCTSAPEPQNTNPERSCLDTDTPGLLQTVVLS